ncbi:YceI family protein [Marivirga atlantica]|jgi:polyisoprenoid-binding protein YceI|uniref:YceI family protein n=1 Tax=Marivirga atlantica TaxID=1548457 RepID=A0A937ABZ4_9BACT|nr:YceI family protein [Marivirga atlantica]MBL0766035.1 YceI family protein [Marivirga atlantica]
MKTILILISSILLILPATRQNMSVNNEKTQLTIYGTSSIHDWHIEATNCKGGAVVQFEEGKFSTIEQLTFKVEVASLESGKSAMDDNTVEALKGDKYPYISYELTDISQASGETFNTKGKLTIAGTTKIVNMKATITNSNKEISISGDIKFKMTDFKVDPPTAVFGTIKTGDEITIKFKTVYTI